MKPLDQSKTNNTKNKPTTGAAAPLFERRIMQETNSPTFAGFGVCDQAQTQADQMGLGALKPETMNFIAAGFMPIIEKIKEAWPAAVAALKETDNPKLAREQRLVLRSLWSELEKVRKQVKAESVATGKIIDGIARKFSEEMKAVGVKLDDIEKAEQRAREAKEAQLIAERKAKIAERCPNHFEPMPDDVLKVLTENQFADQLEAAIARKEREEKEAREAAEQAEKERQEAERKRKEQEAAQQAEMKRLREENEKARAKAQKEKEAREQAEKEAEEARQAEAKAKAEKELAERNQARPEMQPVAIDLSTRDGQKKARVVRTTDLSSISVDEVDKERLSIAIDPASPADYVVHEIPLQKQIQSGILQANLKQAVNMLVKACHGLAKEAGWWHDLETGEFKKRSELELIALEHSELGEATEGVRKSCKDDKLPHRMMTEVELADCIIRIADHAGGYGYDLAGALVEKLAYNASRADHKIEARKAEGGKKS